MNKALFLDRDGTINIDTGYVHDPEKFIFIDGIFDFCREALANGFIIIIITNQSGIERGYFTEEDYQCTTKYMLDQFTINGITITDVLHCPYLTSPNRKPAPGLFLKAKEKYDINMSASINIGDKERDLQAGRMAGVGRNVLFTGLYPNFPLNKH